MMCVSFVPPWCETQKRVIEVALRKRTISTSAALFCAPCIAITCSHRTSTTMEGKESIHLEIKEGTGSTGEGVWSDAGPIHLLDNPQQLAAAAHDGAATTATPSSARAIPKEAKEWLLSNHSVKTKRDRQNLYLFRNAPNGGKNTNLLILLHGAGDSHRPFDKLAQTMSLSQTATLSIHARVCGMELPFGLGMSWFQELDYNSGNALPRNDSSRQTTLQNAVRYMVELLQRLCHVWVPECIFILGYGAGATAALETCRLWTGPNLGGAICVGMDGLGSRIIPSTTMTGSPILILSENSNLMKECKSEYESCRGNSLVETHLQAKKGMISSPSEMKAVMRFLSKRLVLAAQFPKATNPSS
jgi:predicted esterase